MTILLQKASINAGMPTSGFVFISSAIKEDTGRNWPTKLASMRKADPSCSSAGRRFPHKVFDLRSWRPLKNSL